MVFRKSAVGSVLLGCLLALTEFTPEYVSDRLVAGGSSWLPQLETAGQTVTVYLYLLRGGEFVVGTLAVFALGYWVGTRLDLRTEYRRFALTVGFGGAAGYLTVVLAIPLAVVAGGGVGLTPVDLFGGFVIAMGLTVLLEIGVQFAIIAFAGAAFAQLVGDSTDPGVNARTDDTPTSDPTSSAD